MEELFPSLFFVAENAEKDIIGSILGGIHRDDPKTGKLIRIGVVQNYQRKECGTKLTEALFSAMKERNVTAVHLTVAETNKPAIAFYQKIGFMQKERIQNYFYPTTPRLVLWKTLQNRISSIRGATASEETAERNAAASAYGFFAAICAAAFFDTPGNHLSAEALRRLISIGTGSAVTDR